MHIVYLIKLNRTTLPNKYIGSKSNATVVENKILDKNGNIYTGSSTDSTFKELVKHCDYSVQILASFDNYDDALNAEKLIQENYDVVASPEYFNKAIATISNYTNPNYATYKHVLYGKVARLPRNHPKVLNGEWVGVSKGTILTEEERKKRGRPGELNPFYGKKHSEETKKLSGTKIGNAHRGKPKTEEQRRKMAETRRLWWIENKKRKESGKEESL